jgi:hypothetical protein
MFAQSGQEGRGDPPERACRRVFLEGSDPFDGVEHFVYALDVLGCAQPRQQAMLEVCALLMEAMLKFTAAKFWRRAGQWRRDAEVGEEQIGWEDTFESACRLHFTVQRQ